MSEPVKMSVNELIKKLQEVEDKSLPVMISKYGTASSSYARYTYKAIYSDESGNREPVFVIN